MRVIEYGGFGVAYAGRLFGDRGADVIKLEPPGGDPARKEPPALVDAGGTKVGSAFAYFHVNKRFVTLDFERPGGEALLLDLVRSADVLLVEEPYAQSIVESGLSARLVQSAPHLVLVAVTSFGLEGPYASFKADDLVGLAMSGLLGPSGARSGPPTRFPGHMTDVILGLSAAASASMALLGVQSGGGGRFIDISKQAVLTSLTTVSPAVPKFLQEGFVGRRGKTTPAVPSMYYPTKDGLVRFSIYVEWMWPIFARWIHEVTGDEEVLSPKFENPNRGPYADLIDHWTTELTQSYTTEEILVEARARKLTLAPLNTLDGIHSSPQLQERDYFQHVPWLPKDVPYPGPAYRTVPDTWELRLPPGEPGRDNTAVFSEIAGLSDVRVKSLVEEGVL